MKTFARMTLNRRNFFAAMAAPFLCVKHKAKCPRYAAGAWEVPPRDIRQTSYVPFNPVDALLDLCMRLFGADKIEAQSFRFYRDKVRWLDESIFFETLCGGIQQLCYKSGLAIEIKPDGKVALSAPDPNSLMGGAFVHPDGTVSVCSAS